jgi:hypothetical protein
MDLQRMQMIITIIFLATSRSSKIQALFLRRRLGDA